MSSSSASSYLPHTRWTRVRMVLNWLNLSTPLGLLLAWLGGSTIVRRGRGTYLATGYRWPFPVATAFAVGCVIISKHEAAYFVGRPRLLQHEDRHCTQYAFMLGLLMLPIYFGCAAVSWIVAGDHWSYNPFERLANLTDGNYLPPQTRDWRKMFGFRR